MSTQKHAWHAMTSGGKSRSTYSLDELRATKQVDGFLTESVPGPAEFGWYLRAFRYLMSFGMACVAEDKYPPLTRCWNDLERRFMGDPAFDDGVFVQGWALIDFPFGPAGQTALDYFEAFIQGTEAASHFQAFIDAARASRLGLHQDVMRTKKVATFRELISRTVIEAFPSVDEYGKGEILLVRTMKCGDRVFLFGNPKGFPKENKEQIADMVVDKLLSTGEFAGIAGPMTQYETFMKLAGPYWMSCVCSDHNAPILAPDHYRTYLDSRA